MSKSVDDLVNDFLKDSPKSRSSNDFQIGGDHYRKICESQDFQPWDFITKYSLSYLQGNIVKYVFRFFVKRNRADLQKAVHYASKLIEVSLDDPCEEVELPELESDLIRLGFPYANDPHKDVISWLIKGDPVKVRQILLYFR